jgi:O-antigen ligase/polysaccharide polymerase Wzy-like membrane protein
MITARAIHRYEPVASVARTLLGDRFLLMLAVVLAGYALDGRAFAYLGLPPIFVGEMTLLAGMFTLLSTPHWPRMFRTTQALVLLPFMLWGLLRTAPFVAEYQIDALRDAVLWGYSIFAFYIAAILLADTSRLSRLFAWYDRFSRIFLVAVPIVWCITHFLNSYIPSWPWVDQHMIQIKEGDALVHLAGILAFWATGLGPKVSVRWIILLTLDVAICGVIDRAGLMSFLFVFFVCFALKPKSIIPWRIGCTVGAVLSILAITGISVQVPGGKDRELSFAQIKENVLSISGDTKSEGLSGTKEWRMEWWHDIVNYTVHGRYFWGGKGYGINLADDDGYQVGDGTLRSPHNVHMTILARSGVTGALLWAAVLVTFAYGVGWGHLIARRRGQTEWATLFLFIGCYWAAFVINASFDVFLEGPMGGIWFWTVYGIGISCLWLYRNRCSTGILPVPG